MSNESVQCYIAKCLCGCGSIVFASVDEPGHSKARRDDTAQQISKLISDGFTIERMAVEDVRRAPFGCRSKQLDLV